MCLWLECKAPFTELSIFSNCLLEKVQSLKWKFNPCQREKQGERESTRDREGERASKREAESTREKERASETDREREKSSLVRIRKCLV